MDIGKNINNLNKELTRNFFNDDIFGMPGVSTSIEVHVTDMLNDEIGFKISTVMFDVEEKRWI
jgi:hypothetical protein